MRRPVTLLVVTAIALGFAAPARAQAASLAGCRAGAGYEVCFNDPTGGINQRAVLFRRLRKLIDAAGPGDTINVAMYSWDRKGRQVTNALVGAQQRGATVGVVADSAASPAQLDALRAGGVGVSVCVHSCTSHVAEPDSIQHVKLFLANIKGRKHTVVSTSNLTGRQRDELANDSVRSYADDGLYDYYAQYWLRLLARSWYFPYFPFNGWDNADRVFKTRRGNTAMVFQRTDRDPVVRILRGVRKCTRGHRRVWVGASLWTRGAIRTRLSTLKRRYGCDVRVVVGPDVESAFVRRLPTKTVRRWPIHHKLLIIDATVGRRVRRVVYTGSHNFTRNALVRNDEIWTGYTSPFVVGVYSSYFKRLWARAGR